MPFVVPGQQQPQSQQRDGRGGGMERRDYASQQPGPAYRPPQQQQQARGGGYSPWQQQRQMQYRQPQRQQYAPQGRGGYQQPQYQPPQQRQYQPQSRQQMPAQGSDEYNRYDPRARAEMDAQRRYQGQNGGMSGYRSTYDQPQAGYSNREMASNYARQQQEMSNRPQQGNYVGEGVYADGTPMPPDSGMANFQDVFRRFAPATFHGQSPIPSSGFNGQSLVQSNAGPAGGVYANFNATPDVIGGVTPRPYYEEEDTYNKPMRTGRGQGGIR